MQLVSAKETQPFQEFSGTLEPPPWALDPRWCCCFRCCFRLPGASTGGVMKEASQGQDLSIYCRARCHILFWAAAAHRPTSWHLVQSRRLKLHLLLVLPLADLEVPTGCWLFEIGVCFPHCSGKADLGPSVWPNSHLSLLSTHVPWQQRVLGDGTPDRKWLWLLILDPDTLRLSPRRAHPGTMLFLPRLLSLPP